MLLRIGASGALTGDAKVAVGRAGLAFWLGDDVAFRTSLRRPPAFLRTRFAWEWLCLLEKKASGLSDAEVAMMYGERFRCYRGRME